MKRNIDKSSLTSIISVKISSPIALAMVLFMAGSVGALAMYANVEIPSAVPDYAFASNKTPNLHSAVLGTTTTLPAGQPHLYLSPSSFTFNAKASSGTAPAAQAMGINNMGTGANNGAMAWTAVTNQSWCHLDNTSGTANTGVNSIVNITVSSPTTVGAGTHNCTVTVTAPSSDNISQTASVVYTVAPIPTSTPTPTPTPTSTPTPTPTPPPTSSGLQPGNISTCGEITKSGVYTLTKDLSSNKECFNIHDTSNVTLRCAGHTITVDSNNFNYTNEPGSLVKNVNGYTIDGCNINVINAPRNYSPIVIAIITSSNGVLTNNTFIAPLMDVYDATTTYIGGNRINASLQTSGGSDLTISNNTFKIPTKDLYPGVIVLLQTSNAIVSGNNLDGNADGLGDQNGADDGIVAYSTPYLSIKNNSITNIWDCGIENTGVIDSANISYNNISNAVNCGIGGWYGSSWKNGNIEGNTVINSHNLFDFFRADGLGAGETNVYFINNTFKNNKFVNLIVPYNTYSSRFDYKNVWKDVATNTPLPDANKILGNNEFIGNDFGTSLKAPIMLPGSMFVDGGGNICGPSDQSDFPLHCSAVTTPTSTAATISKPTISGSATPHVGDLKAYNFTATSKYGSLNYDIDWGDGSAVSQASNFISGVADTQYHIWQNVGTYTIAVTVSDAANNSAVNTMTVTVSPAVGSTTAAFLVNPKAFNFKATQGDVTYKLITGEFINVTNSPVTFNFEIDNQPSWFNGFYATTTFASDPNQAWGLSASVNPTGLASGTYTTNIKIVGNFTGSPIIVPVTLTVNPPPITPVSPTLSINPFILLPATAGQAYSSAAIAFTQKGNSIINVNFSGLPNGIGMFPPLGSGLPPQTSQSVSPDFQFPTVIPLTGAATQAGTYLVKMTLDNGQGLVVSRMFNFVVNPGTITTPRLGQLILKSDGTVYLVGNGGLYGFPDASTFYSWGYSFSQVLPANSAEQALAQIGLVPSKIPGCSNPLDEIEGKCGTPVSSAFTVSLSLGSPISGFVSGGSSNQIIAVYNFVVGPGSATIRELDFSVVGSSSTPITTVTAEGVTTALAGNVATITGLNWSVPSGNAGINLPVKVNYAPVGINGVPTGQSFTLNLTGIKYFDGAVVAHTQVVNVASNKMTLQ